MRTLKVDELHRVKQNQNSPLLRLPPEIRNRIWEYTLGHNTFRFGRTRGRKARSILAPDEPGINVAILRGCRQIYSETALMPIQLNTLAFLRIRDVVGRLRRHQQKQVTTIRFEVPLISCWHDTICSWKPECILAWAFPALNRIEFYLYNLSHPANRVTLENAERGIRQHYEQFLADTSVRITVKGLAEPMPESYYNV